MFFEKATIEKVLNILYESGTVFKESDVTDFCCALEGFIHDKENQNNHIDLIDREAYFASTLWCEADIREALRENDLPDTYTDILGHSPKERLNSLIHSIITDEMYYPFGVI